MEPITLLLIILAANATTAILIAVSKKIFGLPPRDEPSKGKVHNPPPPLLFVEIPDNSEGFFLRSQLMPFPYYPGFMLPGVSLNDTELKEGEKIQFEVTIGKMLENQKKIYRAINLRRLQPTPKA